MERDKISSVTFVVCSGVILQLKNLSQISVKGMISNSSSLFHIFLRTFDLPDYHIYD